MKFYEQTVKVSNKHTHSAPTPYGSTDTPDSDSSDSESEDVYLMPATHKSNSVKARHHAVVRFKDQIIAAQEAQVQIGNVEVNDFADREEVQPPSPVISSEHSTDVEEDDPPLYTHRDLVLLQSAATSSVSVPASEPVTQVEVSTSPLFPNIGSPQSTSPSDSASPTSDSSVSVKTKRTQDHHGPTRHST